MLLSAQSIAALEGVRRVHTLNPSAIRLDKSLGDEVGLKNIGVHLMTIAPGDKSTEFHTHKYEDEAIYVLSGHGTEVIGDEKHKIGPGGFHRMPGRRRGARDRQRRNRDAGLSCDREATRACRC